jgi:diguanylate cyclase (GGDEF)-like protein
MPISMALADPLSGRDRPGRIVVVDDLIANAQLLAAMLEDASGATVEVFSDGAEAMAWCDRHGPDLVLLDYRMPGMDGLACLQHLRRNAGVIELPVIMITSDESAETLQRAFEAGATDFLRKPVTEIELLARCGNLLRLRLRHQALVQANRDLTRLANEDSLTGAINRRRFMELGETEVDRARRHARPLSLVMLDIDHFKGINDTLGHAVGDAALKGLVEACRKVLRASDLLARLGGEEFAVLLPETPIPHAADAAERLRATIAGHVIEHDGVAVRITASLGVAQWTDVGESLSELLNRADAAMYLAKTGGRNRAVLARPPAQG